MRNAILIAPKLYMRDAISIAPKPYMRDVISIAPKLYMRSQLHRSPTLLTCSSWGGGFSFFFLSGIGGIRDKYGGEIDGEAVFQDLLGHLVHVNNMVVDS